MFSSYKGISDLTTKQPARQRQPNPARALTIKSTWAQKALRARIRNPENLTAKSAKNAKTIRM